MPNRFGGNQRKLLIFHLPYITISICKEKLFRSERSTSILSVMFCGVCLGSLLSGHASAEAIIERASCIRDANDTHGEAQREDG